MIRNNIKISTNLNDEEVTILMPMLTHQDVKYRAYNLLLLL